MKFSAILFGLVILLGSLAITAKAQSTTQMSVDEYKKGRAYLEAKDYTRAVEHLNNSIALKPSSGAYMDLGLAYFHLRKFDAAVSSFKEVMRTAPNNADVHYWLAYTYQTKGTELFKAAKTKDLTIFQNAETEAREALRLRPNFPSAYYILGSALYIQGKTADAVAALEQVLRSDRDAQGALYLLALGYAKLGRKNEALQLQERLSTLDRAFAADLLTKINAELSKSNTNSATASTTAATPGSAEYHLNEGYKQRDAKNYQQAVASFKRAITLKPSLAAAHFNLGYCQYLLKQYMLALPAFLQAVKLEPNDSSHHYWLGCTYFHLKRYDSALASLQEAIRLKPDDAYSHHWLGEVYAEGFKQYEKAIVAYRESVRLKPDYAIAHNQLGLAYSQIDETEAAAAAFQQAVQVKPAEPLYHSNLGSTYLQLGRKEDAVAVQRKLQTLDPVKAKELGDRIETTFPADKDTPDFLLIMGAVVSYRPETALAYYRRVIFMKSDPDAKAAAYSGMGDAYKGKNNTAKATAAFQQALTIYQRLVRLKPNDANLLYNMGHCYARLGLKEQALQIYKRLQTLDPKFAKDLLDEINKAR